MPELPEVETTLRGIKPHILNQTISSVITRKKKLRWPIPPDINQLLTKNCIKKAERRGKYILLSTNTGTIILHLGMSGTLKITDSTTPIEKHDHIDINFANNTSLRLNDPRRFGAFLWSCDAPESHFLLKNLGPEPLNKEFSDNYLYNKSLKRKIPVKNFIMNSQIVVGVGNIYANEALFDSKINPQRLAQNVTQKEYQLLVKNIKTILKKAIKKGGTTLKDFKDSEGKPGYFSQELQVYGRKGLPCLKCKTELLEIRLGQRSTVYCPKCQPRDEP